MTIVVGTAGHIDHGKTTLLRVLTGIDADRLPDEQRRGMTIDVGYAHLRLPDGEVLDFVDVPGHDRLIGNMLVGAGEIDAAMLVVAADDGPGAQTREHLELLDALGIADGLAVVTKIDLFGDGDSRPAEVAAQVRGLLAGTSLAAAPIVPVSSATGQGIESLVLELAALRRRTLARLGPGAGRPRLAIDRSFSIRGRGAVVTGTLRGGSIVSGDTLRLEPGGRAVRVREVQVHGTAVPVGEPGRVALNLVGAELAELGRGRVLAGASDSSGVSSVEVSQHVLIAVRPAASLDRARVGDRTLRHGMAIRVHTGTEQVGGTLVLGRRVTARFADSTGRDWQTALLRLDRPIAVAAGDRLVVRRPSPSDTLAGGVVLDAIPPIGMSRRRSSPERLAALGRARRFEERLTALVALHGALPLRRRDALAAAVGGTASAAGGDGSSIRRAGRMLIDPELVEALESVAVAAVTVSDGEGPAVPGVRSTAAPAAPGRSAAAVRAVIASELRRRASIGRTDADAAADDLVDQLAAAGRLIRSGDRMLVPGQAGGPSEATREAMDRLEAVLAVPAPPPLAEAARLAGCPSDGVRALEAAGRITRLEDDLAWATPTLQALQELALRLAWTAPLTPAAFRDATGTSRRYTLAVIEDLDRHGILARTPIGHVPGPRARLPEATR